MALENRFERDPRRVAAVLLGSIVPFIGSDEADAKDAWPRQTIRSLITSGEIGRFVNGVSGRDAIHCAAFERIAESLLRLAGTGTSVTSDSGDEAILAEIVANARRWELRFKEDVNPHNAIDAASFERMMRDVVGPWARGEPLREDPSEISADEMERQQSAALHEYQYYRFGREALEIILDTTKRINRLLDRSGPDRPR